MNIFILVMQNCTYTLLLALKSHLRDIYMKYLFAARGNVLKLIGQYAFQVLSKEDNETLNLCQNMMETGEWPPLMVVFDPQEG